MNDSDTILKRLLSLHPKRIDLSLGRIERLLEALGHPEKRLPPVIHVAGTNGKGSVTAYCRAVLETAGCRVHVYTSPHLVHFHERIRLAHAQCSAPVGESELAAALDHCERVNDGAPITFFEITTAAAFHLFARHEADYLVLEVGLGGRLDATNVIERPAVSVITQIALDHPEFLGDTLALVAREKAGIMRRGVPCVVAKQDDEVLSVLRTEAARAGAPLLVSNEEWQAIEQQGRLVFQDEDGLLDLALPRLPGRHQIENAGTAIRALRSAAGGRLAPETVDAGLARVDWPARMQRLGPGRLWTYLPADAELWLDGGHNPAAGLVLAQAMSELEERVSRPLVLVTGMINSKDVAGFLAPFAGLASGVVTVTIPGEENAVPAGDLAAIARAAGLAAQEAGSLEQALAKAGQGTSSPRILICGSLYLAGRVLAAHQA
ncbi:MAG TPA: folylpolyglutamate synthase/dihydrofolate synthase family protein [Hyphomicrobiales bacterium]|nr:bifunctional folylpolyglutamate synthase/dihydrofolate synthase [Rhodobiaceae bacterium]HXK53623.1 folylpolyglutamate synthase/dihydrofolate synthase family protein [Hyphomicrobiales bacterium]